MKALSFRKSNGPFFLYNLKTFNFKAFFHMQMRHTSSKMPKVKIMSCFATLGPSQSQLLIFTGGTLIMAVL